MHPAHPTHPTGQTALVAGGSRGLGLLVARELASRGFHVEVCARDADELGRARTQLADEGLHIGTTVCDVVDGDAVTAWVASVADPSRPTSVAIHVAGVIHVGPVTAADASLFDEAIDIMARGPVHLCLAVLPSMRAQGRGRVGIVSSIGGVVPVPHLVAYTTAKFAAAGLGQSLYAELSGTGVTVTTVLPPIMRVGSHLHAQFSGDRAREYAWFAPGASLPGVALDGRKAAHRLVNGVLAGKPVIGLSPLTHVAMRVHGVAPATTTRALGLVGRLLPGSEATAPPLAGRDVRRRHRSRVVAVLTAAGERMARRTNEAHRASTDPPTRD